MITNESMKEYVNSHPNLVNKKDLGNGMFLLKYKNKVFYDDLCDEHNKECRGTIVDKDFNLIQYPFTKIFNYGIEKQAPVLPDDTPVTAYRKVNGFMVAMTWHQGKVLVSTTGSIDSIFAQRAKEFIIEPLRDYILMYSDYTHLFECVHRDDPHIIPEYEGLYYLGKRLKTWGSKIIHTDTEVDQPCPAAFWLPPLRMTLGELTQRVKINKQEGFVFYTKDGISSKFKSPYYLVKKLFARGNTDKLLARDIKRAIDEEYYPLVDHIRANREEFTNLDEQARLAWIREYLEKSCVLG